jgi:membrane-associated HD superfamily phosphohydrolase
MHDIILSYGFQYGCHLFELGLIVFVAQSNYRSRPVSAGVYLSCLLAAGLARICVLQRYGLASRQYFHAYWSTDFLLVTSAFVLVCLFFRRACRDQEKMWRYVRPFLLFVFLLVVGISGLIFSHNYFVFEFNQNLYFTCLVLNTLLYLLLQHIGSTDDQLGLLVCGVGIQFAGPAATLALVHLIGAVRFAQTLNSLVMRICALGMLLVWAYAIVHVKDKAIKVTRREIPVLAEVTADLNV